MIPEMILYLLKVNIALLLFYAGYYFILQRYTFHTLNRFYLLTALVYSALYPLIDLQKILRNQQLKEQIITLTPDWQGSITYIVSQAENDSGRYWQLIIVIFWAGVIFMSLRLIVQLVSLLILHSQSSSATLAGFKFRRLSKTVNPFSFWRTIYLNPECHNADELESILEHEQVHVRQLHTLDVLLAELSTIFYWFNPGVWLIKKAIKANLEFITDQAVINCGIDRKVYQYTLLKSQLLPQSSMPINNFHFLTIKKRIAMINKKPSSRINLSNYILILPLIMLLVLCVGTSKDALSGTNIVSNVKEHLLDSGGASEALNPSKFEGGSKKPINNVSNIDNLNKLVFETLNTIKHVALADTDKSGIQIKQIKEREPDIKHLTIRVNGQDTIKDLIYLIDGIRVITPIKRLEPSSIASINVIKGIEATKLYGAEAANGVISITTKSLAETKNNIRNIPPDTSDSNAGEKISLNNVDADIFILDGKEVSKETIDEMQVSTIGSIEVLKGAAAIAKYGEKVKKGVVIVTSKK